MTWTTAPHGRQPLVVVVVLLLSFSGLTNALRLAPLEVDRALGARRGRGVALHRNTALDAPNVWQVPMPEAALAPARKIFDLALLPRLRGRLVDEVDARPVPCASIDTAYGRFFLMRGGSSTNQSLRGSSDLSWISVDDRPTFDTFARIFEETGLAEAVAPLVEHGERVVLYSSFYVVRSRCAAPNLHADWPDAVGTNAFTLLTPLDDYDTADFQLLYETWAAEPGPRPADLHQ